MVTAMSNVPLAPLMFIENCVVVLFIIGLIYFLIAAPIIFHLFIIPKIEKRLGKKLQYKQVIYQWQVFAKWFVPVMDIGFFITILYLTWKITGKKKIEIWEKVTANAYALAQTNYDIAEASYFEIFMSFLSVIYMFYFGVIMVIQLIKLSIIKLAGFKLFSQ